MKRILLTALVLSLNLSAVAFEGAQTSFQRLGHAGASIFYYVFDILWIDGEDVRSRPLRERKVEFVDDKDGKPEGINRFIGRRPVFAFGNSDGDKEMLEWTAAGSGARFMGLVHHTDAVREWAYDRNSPVGRLDKAWDEAVRRGWTVVHMKRDWKKAFPFDPWMRRRRTSAAG